MYVGCLAAQGDGVGGRKVFPVPEEAARPVRKSKAVSQPVLHLTAVLFVHLCFSLPTYNVFNLPTKCSTFPPSVQPSHRVFNLPTECSTFPPSVQPAHRVFNLPLLCVYRFKAVVDTDHFVVKTFDRMISVSSYRTPVPSDTYLEMLQEVRTNIRMYIRT